MYDNKTITVPADLPLNIHLGLNQKNLLTKHLVNFIQQL